FPRESRPGKYEHVRIQDIATQEIPGLTSMVVGGVETNVTTPHHRRPRLSHCLRQPGRLGIMQDHDVVRTHQLREALRTRRQGPLVNLALAVAQRAAVPGESV